jgi:hypothetical protein
MKRILPFLLGLVVAFGSTDAAMSSVKGRTLTDINMVPTRVLQNSVSPKFYKSLLVSPLEGLITVRGQISGARIVGAKVIRSELSGLFDPLAMQLAKEAEIAGNFTLDRPNIPASVLLHCLVYKIADGTMVLSFAHFDGPGGDQMKYYGCARLLVLKNNKWTEIAGPDSLHRKGWAVRQGLKNDLKNAMRLENVPQAAEVTNMNAISRGQ